MFAMYSTLAQISAAAPADAPSTANVVIVGFLFVMIVLALLAAVTSTIGAFFIKQAARDAAKAAEAAQQACAAKPAAAATAASAPAVGSATPEPADDGENPALLAVIAAAVHTVMGDRAHRVVSVRSSGPGWAQEGRRQIFSSHRVR
jgi:Na+-transporting methylmalonyl-CoA/oxaloacetate decarboxylase gamma subunit